MSAAVGTNTSWTVTDIPDLHGRVALVTGANSGIGFETAKALAGHGATVVLACRDADKAVTATERIGAQVPGADLRTVRLDLASLGSVRAAAEQIHSSYQGIDLLINNAGLMWPPQGLTEDGFEIQLGTNHLGHFALTGLLLDLLTAPGSRVVTVSSVGHKRGTVDFDDLQFQRRKYNRSAAYGQSKLANLLFAYELQRRLAAAGSPTVSLAAHPGMAATPLMRHVTGPTGLIVSVVLKLSGQRSVEEAALPTLRAATDPAATGGQYYGPDGRGESRGLPTLVASNTLSNDAELQRRLWQESEKLTGVTYKFG